MRQLPEPITVNGRLYDPISMKPIVVYCKECNWYSTEYSYPVRIKRWFRKHFGGKK